MHRRALKPSLHKQANWSGPVGGGDGVTHIHCPLTQVWPEAQTFPQAPQLLRSVCSLTHIPLQQLWPEGQSPCEPQVQAPLTHVSPEAHTCPQAPQLLASLWVFLQVPLQQLSALEQQVVLVPLPHT